LTRARRARRSSARSRWPRTSGWSGRGSATAWSRCRGQSPALPSRDAALAAPDFETAGRELVRAAVAASDEEPGWTPLLIERRLTPDDHLETLFEEYAVALMQAFIEERSTT
jgi:hypothetical protein